MQEVGDRFLANYDQPVFAWIDPMVRKLIRRGSGRISSQDIELPVPG